MSTYVCHNSACSIRGKLVRRCHRLYEDPICFLCKTQLDLVQAESPWKNSMQQLVDEAYENAPASTKEFEFPPKINVRPTKTINRDLN